MGRSKLEEYKKRRRYVFLLAPSAGDIIDGIEAGGRSRFASDAIEGAARVVAPLLARIHELEEEIAALHGEAKPARPRAAKRRGGA